MKRCESPVDSILNRYRAFARSTDWGIYRLAKQAGLADRTLKDIFSESWNPTSATLRKIEAVIPAGWHPPEQQPASGPSP